MNIRALSLTRPWPFAFINGQPEEQKRVENRSWRVPPLLENTYLALHAAKSWDKDGRFYISRCLRMSVPPKDEHPHSQIFAVCRVALCMDETHARKHIPIEQHKWIFGPYVWWLKDFVKLAEPIECKCAQGLWGFGNKPDVLADLREAYRNAQSARG